MTSPEYACHSCGREGTVQTAVHAEGSFWCPLCGARVNGDDWLADGELPVASIARVIREQLS